MYSTYQFTDITLSILIGYRPTSSLKRKKFTILKETNF